MNMKSNILKTSGTLLIALFLTTTIFAQNYKSYSIQLASYSKILDDDDLAVEMKGFAKLNNLGHLYETNYMSPSFSAPSKIFLGSYVGWHTAKRILAKVKARGFKGSFIIQEYKGVNPDKTNNYNVVQLSSSTHLRMTDYQKIFDTFGEGYIQALYGSDGKYKVVINCFKTNDTKAALADAKRYGYTGWARDIRKVYNKKPKKRVTNVKKEAAKTKEEASN